MPLPENLNTKTVTIEAYKGDGTAEVGHVEFTLASPIQRTDGSHVVTPSKVRAVLDATGKASVTLALSSDDDYTPNTVYNVSVSLSAWKTTRTITLDETTEDNVSLWELLPAPAPSSGVSYLTQSIADSLYAPLGSTGGGGGGEVTWVAVTGKPSFHAVATSGAYSDLTGRPTIPDSADDVGAAPAVHAHPAADVSDSTATGRAVMTAASQTAARTAIGAGTSSLALGTTASTAKAGNWAPGYADLPAGTTLTVVQTATGTIPARPTSRTDLRVYWIGWEDPSAVMLDGDVWREVTAP